MNGNDEVFLAEVVTYDPIRRRGFLKVIDRSWPRRILFVLGDLEGPLKDQLLAASRELNRAKKKPNSSDAFRSTMNEIKRLIHHQRRTISIRHCGQGGRPRAVVIAPELSPPAS